MCEWDLCGFCAFGGDWAAVLEVSSLKNCCGRQKPLDAKSFVGFLLMNPSVVFAPILCISGGLLVVVFPGPFLTPSLTSEALHLERENTWFTSTLSARLCMKMFLQPLPFSRCFTHPMRLWSTVGLQNFGCQWVWRSPAWLLSPWALNKSCSYFFPYFLFHAIFTSQVSL